MLKFENFSLSFDGKRDVLSNISFSLSSDQSLGIIGRNGAGKSTLVNAILNLNEASSKGKIFFNNKPIDNSIYDQVRIIFQDPTLYLSPMMRVGNQILESNRLKEKEDVLEILEILNLKETFNMLPHQLSKGMQQRVLIAMALIAEPKLLIADEATTYLDNSLRDEVISLLKELKRKFKFSLIFISHRLDGLEKIVNRIILLSEGKIIEKRNFKEFITNPKSSEAKEFVKFFKDLR